MRLGTVAALVLVAAALAPAAQAKELQAVTLCGRQARRTFEDRATLREFPTGGETTKLLGPPAPYYGLTFGHEGGHGSFGMYYVPSANALVTNDAYRSGVPVPLDDRTAANLEAARALDARSTRTTGWTLAFAAVAAASLAALTGRGRSRRRD